MKNYSPWPIRRAFSSLVILFLFATTLSVGANIILWPDSSAAQGNQRAILDKQHPLIQGAIAVHNRHLGSLKRIPQVVGTGVGIGPDGLPAIKVFTTRPGVPGIPGWLESIPVQVEMTGMFVALSDPAARFPRPVPIGVSTGHRDITAGTIAARVKDAKGDVYALSNNHVYANQNDANIGDSALQPGPYDGGTDPADKIGELYDFEPIDFSVFASNTIDAAVAKSSIDLLSNSTLPDGYGIPDSQTVAAAIGLAVQKYGRTTGLTHGYVSEINVTVAVCYANCSNPFLSEYAWFDDQIGITSTDLFSAGGDSGSLIVTDDGNKNPVGLLFAGSDTYALANRIDLVLNRFGVSIDDITTSNSPPNSDFSYTTSGFAVSFADQSTDSDGTVIAWTWNFGDGTTSAGQNPVHTYTVSGTYNVTLTVMDNDGNTGTRTKTVTIGGIHSGDLDGSSARSNIVRWRATVTITAHDMNHNPVPNATVSGTWRIGTSTASGSCTTGTGGLCGITSGRIRNSISNVTFTVNNVTHSAMPYDLASNHDPDGDSNGTIITISKPVTMRNR